MSIQKIRKQEKQKTKSNSYKEKQKTKSNPYTLKQWLIIIAFLAGCCLMILIARLAVKGVVEWIRISTAKHQVMGTAAVAEYEGEFTDYNGGMSTGHKYVHYVIQFDETVDGHDRLEYSNTNDYSARLQEGHRYLVVFDRFEDGVHYYDPDDFLPDRIALAVFAGLVIIGVLFRKQLKSLFN